MLIAFYATRLYNVVKTGGGRVKIGEKIKQRRIELDWSLRELSNRMGYANHSTIARIESGAVDIPQSKIVKFAEILNVPIAYLMGMNESEETKKEQPPDYEGLSEKKKDFIEKVMQMSDAELERLDTILSLVENTK